MSRKELEAFAREAVKGIKTEKDLAEFSQMLTRITVETALNAELDDHLGYDEHQKMTTRNSRNGHSSKTLLALLRWVLLVTGRQLQVAFSETGLLATRWARFGHGPFQTCATVFYWHSTY